MGERELLKALEDDARRECNAIIENTLAEADAIIKTAIEEMEKKKKEGLETIKACMQMERTRRLAKARLDARGIVLKERDAGIKRVLEKTRDRLGDIQKVRDYPMVLERLLKEALAEWNGSMKGRDAQVIAAKRDIPLLKKIRASDNNYEIVPDEAEAVPSGVVIASKDRRFRITNTLLSRLER
ncbi:MAG: hypothetical protein A2073_07010, partial [Deltaproteobacteria bacterium GWC2_42_11]